MTTPAGALALGAVVDHGAGAGIVTVIDGERGATYELRNTFKNAAGRRWSRLLTVLVVG